MAKKRKSRTFLPEALVNSKPKDWRWMPYDLAKQYAMRTGIRSHRQYRTWIRNYKPGGMPSNPSEVYIEWDTWNTFLDTNNIYSADAPHAVTRDKRRPYWEAVALIHKLGIKTVEEFNIEFDKGNIPDGIPRNPIRGYRDFTKNGGWPGFLGKTVQSKINAAKEITAIFILYRMPNISPNILGVFIHKTGQAELQKIIAERNLTIVQWYIWEDEQSTAVFNALDQHGSRQPNNNSWLFHNVNSVLFDIGQYLDRWVPKT